MILGIDLGTTNTCVSIYKNNKATIIPIDSNLTIKSIVSFNDKLEYIIGMKNKDYPYSIQHIKRIMGKYYDDLDIKNDTTLPKYCVNHNNKPFIKINNTLFSPEQISSFILKYVKQKCRDTTKKTISKCVITVPAYFNNIQRKATHKACCLAGLEVIRIINEPTAASLAYYMSLQKEETILVYDMGGGTLDVSLLEIEDDVIDVIATSGDTHLGGADIDYMIMSYLLSKSTFKEGVDKLKECCLIKHRLNLEKYVITKCTKKCIIFTKKKFYNLMNSKLMTRMKQPIQKVLKDSKKSAIDIDSIVFIGGTTKNDFIKEEIMKLFPKSKRYDKIDPDLTVAMGASIQSNLIKNNQNKCLLLDVTPFSLGIHGSKNEMIRLINRNETLPISVTKRFTTTRDNQTQIDIKVFQGEHYYTSDCQYLGDFILKNIKKEKKNKKHIDITFNLDVNGVLHIIAHECNTENKSRLLLNI